MRSTAGIVFMLFLPLSAGCLGSSGRETPAAGAALERAEPDAEVRAPADASAVSVTRTQSAEGAFQAGMRSMSHDDYAGAIANLKLATSLEPDDARAWAALGNAYMKLKDYQNGVTAYGRALELSPDSTGYVRGVAYGYLCLNNLSKAEDYYLKLVERDTLSYEGNEELGFIYQKKDDSDYAIKYYRAALRARPDDAATMETLAGIYEKRGDEERTFEYLQKAAEAAPANEEYRARLGLAYMKRKLYPDAIPVFEELAKDRPDEAAYHLNLGLALSQSPDRRAEGAVELEKTLQLKGEDPYVCGVLARIYNDLKRYDKALETANRGLAAGGAEEPMLNYELGTALSNLGRYDDAIAAFQKAADGKDPKWADAAKKQIGRQEALKNRGGTVKTEE
jgi:tetratricopeptide (TPR) repeat protein